jgi:chloramphenicol-sensitive protein RarD
MNKGILYAAGAYFIWGFFPIYFKAIEQISAFQVTAHRVVWSFLFLILVVAARRELRGLRALITRRILLIYLAAGALLAVNWLTYVWAVSSGFVVEASLGYFINPLVSVVLGVVFLHEKLRPAQWLPVALAACGVTYLTISHGSLPWIALVLAFSFGLYGLMKKLAPLGSLHGLVLETGAIFVPALLLLVISEAAGTGAFGHAGALPSLLLALVGVVTAIPLLLFATGAKNVPLTTLGLLQYIAPTIQFLIGVLIYGEPFTPERLVGFGIIWVALVIFSTENLMARRRALPTTTG